MAENDRLMYDWVRSRGYEPVIIATKADKIKRSQIQKQIKIVREGLKADKGTVILVKDSFSHCLAPFLAENYSKVILVDMRYYKLSVSDLAKSENAKNVIVLYGIDNFATDTDLVWVS